MQLLRHPLPATSGLPPMMGWSLLIHVGAVLLLVAADVLSPKPMVFDDVIRVNLIALQPRASAPAPRKKLPTLPPRPKAEPKANPLWDRPFTPVEVADDSPSLSSEFEALAEPSAPKAAKTRSAEEDMMAWWKAQQAQLAPVEAPDEAPDEAPEEVAPEAGMAAAWKALAAARDAQKKAQSTMDPALAKFLDEAGIAPASMRRAKAQAVGGTPHYLALVERRISTRWSPPDIFREREQVRAILSFPVMRDGSLGKVRVVSSSGMPQFDQAAVRSVLLSSPFPPFPEEMTEHRVEIRFGFTLQREGLG